MFSNTRPILHYACRAGNKEFVLYLLSKGISCNDLYYVSKLYTIQVLHVLKIFVIYYACKLPIIDQSSWTTK